MKNHGVSGAGWLGGRLPVWFPIDRCVTVCEQLGRSFSVNGVTLSKGVLGLPAGFAGIGVLSAGLSATGNTC